MKVAILQRIFQPKNKEACVRFYLKISYFAPFKLLITSKLLKSYAP